MNARRSLTIAGALAVTGMFAIPATSAAPPVAAAVQRPGIALAATGPVLDKGQASRRCGCAGRLVGIRAIDATAIAPASYEFTLRMHDGSLHTSPSTSIGSWKVGDRVIVLAGKTT